MFKVNIRNTRTMSEICSKLTVKTAERRHWPTGKNGTSDHTSHGLVYQPFYAFIKINSNKIYKIHSLNILSTSSFKYCKHLFGGSYFVRFRWLSHDKLLGYWPQDNLIQVMHIAGLFNDQPQDHWEPDTMVRSTNPVYHWMHSYPVQI